MSSYMKLVRCRPFIDRLLRLIQRRSDRASAQPLNPSSFCQMQRLCLVLSTNLALYKFLFVLYCMHLKKTSVIIVIWASFLRNRRCNHLFVRYISLERTDTQWLKNSVQIITEKRDSKANTHLHLLLQQTRTTDNARTTDSLKTG